MTASQGRILLAAALVFLACSWPGPAHAYIGPAIAFVSYLFGPVAAVVAAIGIILYLPLKMVWKKFKKAKGAPDKQESDEASAKNEAE